MNTVELLIDGVRVDLFQDEDIKVKLQVKRLQDISKSFGDYSQQFTIPASPKNNAALRHYTESLYGNQHPSIDLIEAEIRVNGQLYKEGSVSVDNAKLTNGQVSSYQVTFFGKLTDFAEGVKTDTLRDLTDLDNEVFTFAPATVINAMQSRVNSISSTGDLFFPLIFSEGYTQVHRYLKTVDGDDLPNATTHYVTNENDDAVPSWKVFKPAVSFKRILEAIEVQYGIKFGGIANVNGSHPLTENLFMWCNQHPDNAYRFYHEYILTRRQSDGLSDAYVTNGGLVLDYDNDGFTISGTSDREIIDINMFIEGNYVTTKQVTNKNFSASFVRGVDYFGNTGELVTFRLVPQGSEGLYPLTITEASMSVVYERDGSGTLGDVTYISDGGVGDVLDVVFPDMTIKKCISDMKISDFMNGICRLYNANIIPNGRTADNTPIYSVLSNADLYDNELDITDYLNIESIDMSTPAVYKEIKFQFNKSQTAANLGHSVAFGQEWGNDDISLSVGKGKLDVKIPFTNLKWTYGGYQGVQNDGENIPSVAHDTDDKGSAKNTQGVIFYAPLTSTITSSDDALNIKQLGYEGTTITPTPVNTTVHATNFVSGVALSFQNVYKQRTNDFTTQNLYTEYWSDYITSIYDSRARKVTVDAVLPYGLVRVLKANSLITIRGVKYTIDSAEVSLKDGKTRLVLINNGYLY